jgi:hypothetical protein
VRVHAHPFSLYLPPPQQDERDIATRILKSISPLSFSLEPKGRRSEADVDSPTEGVSSFPVRGNSCEEYNYSSPVAFFTNEAQHHVGSREK